MSYTEGMLRQLRTSWILGGLTMGLIAAAGCGDGQDGNPDANGGSAGVTTSSGVAGGGGVGIGGQGGEGGEVELPINEGFIGGPCTSDEDCDYDGGFCLTEP